MAGPGGRCGRGEPDAKGQAPWDPLAGVPGGQVHRAGRELGGTGRGGSHRPVMPFRSEVTSVPDAPEMGPGRSPSCCVSFTQLKMSKRS